jgi:IS1 family transposase
VRGVGKKAARRIYKRVKELTPNISAIYTDENSCYDVVFAELGLSNIHTMTKRETHLIESSNSSIRDNLARFNRKSKRFAKSWEMLYKTLNLFINRNIVRKFL